ncbi:2-polyprenylphenol hydroxylase [Metallosphaera tengchongensis]|uniref:2-polyprenylphenol hydroxylase n=1 Tax=Metallosphaera tengchongensis TaxID=1532350 RepID=A0A6N0NRP8_9CREN|nr:2-polyprenylphenol hydroxylase [Metallosphaera tengchongensis]QKQ99553.1 2-polyprenylphenol hydroxylase [Metallosphaera tengchongensis]
MIRSKVVEYSEVGKSHRIVFTFQGRRPLPGQFIALILPGEKEIPLGVTDYNDSTIEVYVDSPKLFKRILSSRYVVLEGPFGKPIPMGNTLGVATEDLFHDVLFPLREAKRKGFEASLECWGSCGADFPHREGVKWDVVVASVPREMLDKLPRSTMVYVRWVNMNCMAGVCGVCQVNGNLACVDGPFLELRKIVA